MNNSFYSDDYSGNDFRRVEKYYTKFWYNQVDTAPGLTWCTEYFYKKMKNGKYRLVTVDAFDNYLSAHEEYNSAKGLVNTIFREAEYTEFKPCEMDIELMELFPNDLKPYPQLVATTLNELTAGLLLAAKHNKDKKLVNALLPDVENIRARIQHATASQFSKVSLERETHVDCNLKYYFEVIIDDSTIGHISFTDGDSYFVNEDEPNNLVYIDKKTIDLFHEVYESEYQEWERQK